MLLKVGRVNSTYWNLGNLLALKFHKGKIVIIFSRGAVHQGICYKYLHIRINKTDKWGTENGMRQLFVL